MATYRTCDALVETLRDFGVRYFFSVSGANIEPIHDSIYLYGRRRLISVLAKHESGAAFMADAHARVHKTLGVCGSTSGGAMLNLLAGVAEANAESVPLLALVGQPPTSLWGKGAFQDSSGIGRALNAIELFRQVSKYTALIHKADEALAHLEEAITASLSGRPGASVLLLPRDVLLSEIPGGKSSSLAIKSYRASSPVDEKALGALARTFLQSKRPVLILGHGVLRSIKHGRIIEFAERYSVPTVVTLSGKSAFPNRHRLFRGVLSVSGHPTAVRTIAEADIVFLIGAGLNLMTRTPLGDLLREKRLVYINVDDEYIDRVANPSLKVLGDAGEIISSLLEWLEVDSKPIPVSLEAPTDLEQVEPPVLTRKPDDSARLSCTPTSLTMYEAMKALRDIIPRGAHLLIDAGNAGATACHLLPCPEGGTFVTALGMGGMGWAVAGSVGAALSPRDEDPRVTIVIAGDGALLMNGNEINTIVAHQLPVIMIVLNNAAHGMCITRQALFFDSRFEAVEYPEVNAEIFARSLAGTLGISTARVTSPQELREVFSRFVAEKKPALIDVLVTKDEVPPFTPFLTAARNLVETK
jgi:acetolactate synthase I/II/III large subunit